MSLSPRAQEVRDYILEIGGIRHWTERADAHTSRSGGNGSETSFQRDDYGLIEELKAAFANKFSRLTEPDWDELADWLFSSVQQQRGTR